MLVLISWLSTYTAALILLVISSFPHTSSAEIISVLDERDVIVDLSSGPGKQTIHNRLGNKGYDVFGFRSVLLSASVFSGHIVYGDADVVCEIQGTGEDGNSRTSRQFSPSLKPVRLDPVLAVGSLLECWLPEEAERKPRGRRGRRKGKKADEEEEASRRDDGGGSRIEDIRRAMRERDLEAFREDEAKPFRRNKWRNRGGEGDEID